MLEAREAPLKWMFTSITVTIGDRFYFIHMEWAFSGSGTVATTGRTGSEFFG